MAKGQTRSNRETRKPKKDKPKVLPPPRSPIGLPDRPSGASKKK